LHSQVANCLKSLIDMALTANGNIGRQDSCLKIFAFFAEDLKNMQT